MVATYQTDGRKRIEQLHRSYFELVKTDGWTAETIINSRTIWHGKEISFPILAFKTKMKGPAIYLLSGIHGEEPTGPNAIAKSIDVLKELGQKHPIILLPLCNPLGYVRNWRYLNQEKYSNSPQLPGISVGDAEHLLIDPLNQSKPRKDNPACLESDTLSHFIIKMSQDYPPEISIDFHGDILIPGGYLYAQGVDGQKDDMGLAMVKILEENEIPIQWEGKTRFGEDITRGIVEQQQDGSIDELIGAKEIIIRGDKVAGPNAKKVFVIETPDADIPLTTRVNAYKQIISFLDTL